MDLILPTIPQTTFVIDHKLLTGHNPGSVKGIIIIDSDYFYDSDDDDYSYTCSIDNTYDDNYSIHSIISVTSYSSTNDEIPKSLCCYYDSEYDDEIFHTLPIQTSSSSIKVYFPNEPVVNFDDIPPNQRDHSKSISSARRVLIK